MDETDQINIIEPKIIRNFVIHQKVGKGAYGVVWKVSDRNTKEVLALKKNYDCYQVACDAQRTYREVIYLKALRNHENIVQLKDIYCAENGKDLYLTFDYMPTDLHVVIRSNILNELHMQYITFQILKALKYVHSAGLMHRDIKPSNVLIDSKCHVKLCDFGLCRSYEESEGKHLTDYTATRWYRPPEVLLCSSYYSTGIDIWATACILGEMIKESPLLPGNSTMNQIEKILEISEESEISHCVANFTSSIIAEAMINCVRVHRRINIVDILKNAQDRDKKIMISDDAISFLKNLLAFDPQKRYSAEMALSHGYLSDFHNPSYEPICKERMRVNGHNFDDNKRLSIERYRVEIGNLSRMSQ